MHKPYKPMPRGIPSAMNPGSTLSGSLGSSWEEWNTCSRIFWGLANCAESYWTSTSWTWRAKDFILHQAAWDGFAAASPGTRSAFVVRFPPLICVCHCCPSACFQLVSSTLSVRHQVFRSWQWHRQDHSLHVRNPGSQTFSLRSLFCFPFLLWNLLGIPDIGLLWGQSRSKQTSK